MLFGIVILLLLLLAWLEIIPVRFWITKVRIRYYGKIARMKIKLIKIFESFVNWFE